MSNKDPMGNPGLSANLLPKFYQTPANKKFLQATIDQLFQPGTVNKVTGFIGRPDSKASVGSDVYIAAANKTRSHYQLEAAATVKDTLGNTEFFKDYQDYINQLNVFGANTTNHARLNKQEMYSWDPHIDWDKFTNFQNYYWLPYGPEPITVAGQQDKIVSGYTVDLVNDGNNNQYVFTPNGFDPNPVLKLYRGQTYTFEINSPGNAFTIRTERSTIPDDVYPNGVTNNGIKKGTVTFKVLKDAPSLLYYQSATDINLGGVIEIFDIDENTSINVAADLLGKRTYKMGDGTEISNGMLVKFTGNVTPASYKKDQYYVEGVGTAIKLVPRSILEVESPYTVSQSVEFDADPFDSLPFSDATGYASQKDYIVINRASRDHNPWSRYNRWFHKSVIETSAALNNTTPSLDQTLRATRPIIEFQADLKLYNFGTDASFDVDLIDNFTTDAFSIIEGSAGYNVDGIDLAQGQVILFTADLDPLVNNKLYRVNFIDVRHLNSGSYQIHLEEISNPVENQTILIKQGLANQSLMYWYTGSTWKLAQQKTNTNQQPLFDLFDNNGISYSDTATYPGSTFKGTPVFSYKVGTGANDTVLGFPLSYQNVSNIGDIVFNFNLANDSFKYQEALYFVDVMVDTGFLAIKDYAGTRVYVNGWQTCTSTTTQAAVRIYKNSNRTTTFPIDIFDNIDKLDDLTVFVYVNTILVPTSNYTINSNGVYKSVVLNTAIKSTDIVTIRAFTAQPCNSKGFYEVPLNIQNNPLNNAMADFTLGEVIDHVQSMIPELPTFSGTFPGSTNLRDLGNITQYGVKFIQHSGPSSLSLYHITNESNNIVKAIEQAREDYNNFKREFVTVASSLGIDSDVITMVELTLEKITKNKPTTAPYYFSDMVPFGAAIKTDLTVVDHRIKTYPLSAVFDLESLSNKAVGVYLNEIQMIYERDYTFDSQGFVVIDTSVPLVDGDTITTVEYENTDACFVPSTPTKLGIWPKFVPEIYMDTTLVAPQLMIQGHDGSQVLAYGDYRDDLILELEKRIYNNIKVKYDETIFDITDIVPAFARTTDYTLNEFNAVLAPNFYKWARAVGVDFSKQLSYDVNNTFTYNYTGNTAPDGSLVPGYWRGVYRHLLDTDRPNLCPWEMLGFSVMPQWWISVYGPAPYTSDNLVMWEDISLGLVKEPGKVVVHRENYVRPFLMKHIPVDESGNLISPADSGLAQGTLKPSAELNFVFGDVGPVEASWRRSSYYPFSVLISAMLMKPSQTFGTLLDRSRIVRNLAGQLIYKDTGLRVRAQDIMLPSTYSSASRVSTAGIINYVVDLIFNYIFSNNQKSYEQYAYDLTNINFQLSYRLGSFTNKDQFNLLLESKTPASTGNVFIPAENYSVILNTSSPVKKITYSGIIVTKLQDSYQVSGYSLTQPYFKYYPYTQSGPLINVGGISEGYAKWTAGEHYVTGSVVLHNGVYYRVVTTHVAGTTFEGSYFASLTGLPYTGGVNANMRITWDKTNPITVAYGTKFYSIQDTYDFIVGYGEWLKDEGFYFNEYNPNLGTVTNWETSAKEFLFWTTQNWNANQEKWQDWIPSQPVKYGTVVRYNGDFYSALTNIAPDSVFNFNDYEKLDGLSDIGSSIISLSPAAKVLKFLSPQSVVADIRNLFNTYEIFKVDGTPIEPNDLDSYRSGNVVSYRPLNNNSIYSASFYLVQNEHVILIDNNTIFNDVIYNPESGYRRGRIKVSGYITTGWYGGLDIPGFIFDAATIQQWQQWQDYNMGDIVLHQGRYYSANSFLPGSATFVNENWTQLANEPTSQILPNWTNLATQFGDFYSLDVDSFDPAQQSMGQHLIGYQKRQYLENIIQDDVSEFKFFQGMIREKGTQNVLNKLFGVLTSDNAESLTFYEEWALRVGQYGASNAFDQIEFTLDEGQFKTNPQGFLLTNQHDTTINAFIIQQTPNQVYLKPTGYTSAPWPLFANENPLLRSAGYVNSGDVAVSIGYLSEIVNQDITKFNNGDYVWCSFDNPPNFWNVYRFTDIKLQVTGIKLDSKAKTFTITTQSLVSTINVGDYIGINQTTDINGFYKVTAVSLNTFTVATTATTLPTPYPELSRMVIYGLISQRVSSIDNLDSAIPLRLIPGEFIWTDDKGDGKWATWEYNPVYSNTVLPTALSLTELNHGRAMTIASTGDISAFSSADGKISVYFKPNMTLDWVKTQVLQAPTVSANFSTNIHVEDSNAAGIITALNIGTLNTSILDGSLHAGSGYYPVTGTQVYNGIPLIAASAPVSGSGAVANITITNGRVTNIVLVSVTTEYAAGDVLTANANDIGSRVGTAFTITMTNTCGTGYVPLAASKTYRNVPLTGGSGVGATADIVVKNGKITAAQIVNNGTGYKLSDILSVDASNIGGSGSGFTVKILSINLNSNNRLSTVLATSSDGKWLAVGSPNAGYASTHYQGQFLVATAYGAKSIVSDSNQFYQTPTALQSSYTNITGTTISASTGALFTINSLTPGQFTPLVVAGGIGYHAGQKIKILGSEVGGIDTINDITITVNTVVDGAITSVTSTQLSNYYKDKDGNVLYAPSKTYSNIRGTLSLGTSATFTVIPTLSGYTISTTAYGAGYFAGDKIVVDGSLIGGQSIINDLIINVNLSNFTVAGGASSWIKVPYIPVDITGTNSSYASQGAVSIYYRTVYDNYTLVDTIISPVATANESFGSTLAFNNNTLYIGTTANKIYTLAYGSIVQASTSYNPVGSLLGTLVVSSTAGIRAGMFIQGTGFTSGQYVTKVVDATTLHISGSPDSTPSGVLKFLTTSWSYELLNSSFSIAPPQNSTFRNVISVNANNSTVAIAGVVNSTGCVFVYNTAGPLNVSPIQITSPTSSLEFGNSISISDDGMYIAVADDYTDTDPSAQFNNYQGSVQIYKSDATGNYNLYQTLVNHQPEVNQEFGNKVAFMNNGNTLVVYSKYGSTAELTTFDSEKTTFDKQSTTFVKVIANSGRVDVYDKYANNWVFSESMPTTDQQQDGYGTGFAVGSNEIFVGAPYYTDATSGIKTGQIWNYAKYKDKYTWTIHDAQIEIPDVTKIKKAFLYNKKLGTLVKYLDIIDPLQGKIAGTAEEEIKYKSFFDPAIYSIGNNTVTVDVGSKWSDQQVGSLWWNLTTAKFVNSYDQDVVYRNNTWNMLAASASIDIYEWVSSNLKPSQWDTIADTAVGVAQGVSGKSLYGDTVYSVTSYVDTISQKTKYTYYFWVKNKSVTPSVNGRNMSAMDVSTLISNPRGQSYTYLALTGANTFSLVNAKQYLSSTDIVLSVEYWTGDKTDQNIHSQWKIISNDPSTILPKTIEQKWFDSLCGVDLVGRPVPDPQLPVKLQYGVENRPRQSMFVNRFEALKQFIETVNSILVVNQIAYSNSITALETYDTPPTSVTGLWDTTLATDTDLNYVNLTSFKSSAVTPIIVDGKITGINIVTAGKGYLVAPYIDILGLGKGARVRATIGSLGEITGAVVESAGQGYTNATQCSVRSYSVLVSSDSQAEGQWSIYAYDTSSKTWSRTLTQSYDVRKYWNYVDWFDTGYNQFTSPEVSINTFADLNTITASIGYLVKVKTANNGKWLLLEKYADSTSVDWTQSYKVVGIENGTIQFSSSLYEFTNTNIGYDSTTFDGHVFDVVANKELRIILTAIKDDLLVGTTVLKQNYLDLFFDSVRYAHNEQVYLDWIFKTSFVKAENYVGKLDQPVNYPVDNIGNFEDYIAEVKPYRTKVREYVNNYSNIDYASSAATDFDLQPLYENGLVVPVDTTVTNDVLFVGDPIVQSYPWKFWVDNLGFQVTEIVLIDGGYGYITEPTVSITSASGSGATARAFFVNGVINRIILVTQGSGYLSAPTVVLEGGLGFNGKQARAIAIIGDSVVRETKTSIKFDRITYKNYITQTDHTETFTANGSRLQFNLTWAPDIRVGQSTVLVNGIPVLREMYKLSVVTSKASGYTQYSGKITFDTSATPSGTVVVNYTLNSIVLNSIDRNTHFYEPTSGMPANESNQLMTGVDYGGVIVDGLNLNVASGWGALPYYSDKWDASDKTFDDYVVTVGADQYTFPVNGIPFPDTWPAGAEINIYRYQINVDSYVSDGVQTEYYYNVYANPTLPSATAFSITTQITATYVPAGSYDTILVLSSTTGIKVGMGVFGMGFVLPHYVTSVNSDTNTVTLNTEPDSTPTGQLAFTFNRAGSNYLSLDNVGTVDIPTIKVGDAVTSTISNSNGDALVYDTTVLSIDYVNNIVQISEILYADIPVGTTVSFKRTLKVPTDITIYSSGIALLKEPLPAGMAIQFTGQLNNARLDAADYVSGQGSPTNPFAVIRTPIADGTSNFTFTLERHGGVDFLGNPFEVTAGDQFFIRRSTSDGSIIPTSVDYDTALSGGQVETGSYSTATGLSPDDIIVDGDGFVTETTSPAPEEVVPGQVVDTLAIKVFDRPNFATSQMRVDNFVSNGVNKVFTLTQQPNSERAIIVKINNQIKTYGTDYTFDYRNKQISLTTAASAGSMVTVFNIGFNGANILDLDYFVADGTTKEFITKARWETSVTSLVYLDGVVYSPELFKTDSTYSLSNVVGFRFADAPAAGVLINFIVVSGSQQTFSVTSTEIIQPNGVDDTFALNSAVGTTLPNETSMIVRVDQNILSASNINYFTVVNGQVTYTLDAERVAPYSAELTDISVQIAGKPILLNQDYMVDLSGITITLSLADTVLYAGKVMAVTVSTGTEYTYDPVAKTIKFAQTYDHTHLIEVITSYDHTYLDIERTEITVLSQVTTNVGTTSYYNYNAVGSGLMELDRSVINSDYVWVIKNKKILTPNVDYKLNDDRKSIQLSVLPSAYDKITLITFGNNTMTTGISYMQFKDMLNRVSYKRLSKIKQTTLASELKFNDAEIIVEDASNLDNPDISNRIPGVIEIRGERIEYWIKNGNTLSQLRRGTLGTGIYNLHKAGSFVQGIGRSETIPYTDTTITRQVISDGVSNLIDLDFVPVKSDTPWSYDSGFTSTIPTDYGQCDNIEVFVGGYKNTEDWVADTPYIVGSIVNVGSYTYRCVEAHTSSSSFIADFANWTFFVGNIRLKKQPYKVHNVHKAPYSPAGDIQLDADFAVDGASNQVRLTNQLSLGTKVTVVQRRLTLWDSKTNIQQDSNKIAEFLKATPGIWYTEYKS